MRRIVSILPGAERCDDVVRLEHDFRSRRRMVFTTQAGEPILLDLPRPGRIRDGDALVLEDGSTVRVEAAEEPLMEIGATSSEALVRIAWHLGNRHLPTQLLPGPNGGRLRIRRDHVIADMVRGLGGDCAEVTAPFDPEGGAYAGTEEVPQLSGHSHGHHHHHHDDDEHSHHSHLERRHG